MIFHESVDKTLKTLKKKVIQENTFEIPEEGSFLQPTQTHLPKTLNHCYL